jgi:protein O-GlcNAc transferase
MSTAIATATARKASTETTGITPDAVREVLAAYHDNPAATNTLEAVLACRRKAAGQIAALPANQKSGPAIDRARELIKLFNESGINDLTVAAEDLQLAREVSAKGWPGLLAAMLLVPSWQWPEAPALADVPAWLWVDYAQYLFYTPQGFTAIGQAEAYAAHALRRLEEVAKVAAANRGSSAVRAVLTVYLRAGNCIPLYFAKGSLRRHFELRAQILSIAAGAKSQDFLLPRPREGRKLRVGFVNRHFAAQTETYTTLPTFEQLDEDEFEVHLFVHHQTNSPIEMYARKRVHAFHALPASVEEQLAALRAADLDVLVFGTNVTAVNHEVTQLALHRIAPLQVVNNSSCVTSGMPEIDLYVSGDMTESAEAPNHFSERLGLLPGPAHAFNYDADAQEPTLDWTRNMLGIPEDALVFVTAANYYKIIPEMQHCWAKLLAAVPNSRLLVHPFNPNWSSEYPIKRFSAEFDRVLASYGVSSDRFLLSTAKFPSRADVKALISVGDIYLDTFPFGGVNSLVDPLQAGLPVVAWEGETFRSRMGSALLRSIDLEDCVARDEAGYTKLCVTLAKDAALRTSVRERIQQAFVHPPIFLDALAASDGFGALLKLAFDTLVKDGSETFRRDRDPIRVTPVSNPGATILDANTLLANGCAFEAMDKLQSVLAASPASSPARHAFGRVLAAQGRPRRAVDYLLAAVEHVDGDAPLWLDLSRILLQDDRRPQAVEALETCLRIDQKYLEGWLFMGELARQSSNYDLLQEIIDVVRNLAPDDPRVGQLISG